MNQDCFILIKGAAVAEGPGSSPGNAAHPLHPGAAYRHGKINNLWQKPEPEIQLPAL